MYEIACLDGPLAGQTVTRPSLASWVICHGVKPPRATTIDQLVNEPLTHQHCYKVMQLHFGPFGTPTHTYFIKAYVASCRGLSDITQEMFPIGHATPYFTSRRKPKPDILTDFNKWLRYVLFDMRCKYDAVTQVDLQLADVGMSNWVRDSVGKLTGQDPCFEFLKVLARE